MHVTVAICTWNRAKLLDQTLTRMAEMSISPSIEWELLVVNNNSTDDTDAVIARHQTAGRLPVRRLFEPTPGQVHARNTAVAAAVGDLLVWTDDDVLVGDRWLHEYTTAATAYPQTSYFGGPILPWFPVNPPQWLVAHIDRFGMHWALLDHGDATRPLNSDEYAFGANIAFRTAALRRYPFDPNTGHVGGRYRGGDETQVQDRMRSDGLSGMWIGSAAVRHYIPPERMTLDYVWRLRREMGAHQYDPAAVAGHPTIASVPQWILRRYVTARVKAAIFSPCRSSTWADAFLSAAYARGMISAAKSRRFDHA